MVLILIFSSVMYLYEAIITLHLEVEYFWAGKLNMSKVLFFANKYIPLSAYILGMVTFAPLPDNVGGPHILHL